MALKPMKIGGRKERAGAARRMVIRHRREGEPVPDTLAPEDDTRAYVDVEHDEHDALVTDPDTIPRP